MAAPADLIDFDIIENQKENIQALPSGRSAKSLAQLYSPVPGITSPAQTQDVHASIRQGYEKEVALIDESDDPLDVYDRYVRWTLNTYPSTSATSQSQLLPLLERATKAFLKTDHYKNDPRYLKLWLQYIRLFSDAPRETFSFLSRNKIGDGLALYYEEFAAWLEGAGRWNQAEEIYKLGIEREARPVERLMRKFGEFEQRAANKPDDPQEPSSPALPVVRPALAAKIDPFSVTSPSAADPQAPSRNAQSTSKKPKLQIFSDDGQESRPSSGEGGKAWESIGTLAERKKENVRAPQPWAGETLNQGSQQNVGVQKMTIFKDKSLSRAPMPTFSPNHPARSRQVVNERTGKVECVFVNLEAVYPNPADPTEEYCFEELRAAKRGWLHRDWSGDRKQKQQSQARRSSNSGLADTTTTLVPISNGDDVANHELSNKMQRTLHLNDENNPSSTQPNADAEAARRFRREERANRTRKIKVREVKNETQTIQTNLDSPRGPKIKRKKPAEPTMTLQTKAATDEIYELFNQTLTLPEEAEEEEEESDSESEDEDDEDDYTSAGESTGTGRISGATSEIGDETQGDLTENGEPTQSEDVGGEDTGWSEFTTSKHMPKDEDDETGTNYTNSSEREDATDNERKTLDEPNQQDAKDESEAEVVTPTSPTPQSSSSGTFYIPIPPEGYVAPTRPYRDAAQVAANRLPFMTPIVEKTESSMGTATAHKDKDYFGSKTPCPKADQTPSHLADTTTELLSSPFQEKLSSALNEDSKIPKPDLTKVSSSKPGPAVPAPRNILEKKDAVRKGPIIADAQCNPMDPSVHNTILAEIQPPLTSFDGYFEHKDTVSSRKTEIKKYCKSAALVRKCGNDKGAPPLGAPPTLQFEDSKKQYAIKRELGAGAYAPVYLVENIDKDVADDGDEQLALGRAKFGPQRRQLEAVKMEDPPSAWEFYILRTALRRLGVQRAADSIIQAYEMHLFKDEGYLVEEYQDQGTLLDLVNAVNDQNRASGGHPGLDEMLAMFFTIEILRTVEALHAKGIIHGDLKADNVLVRLLPAVATSAIEEESLPVQYSRDGTCGWSAKGIKLIDFGRGIDMRAFGANVQFIADWQTSATDCAEMRELRPWTFHADYHGVAAIAHTMLFGKYIETVVEKSSGGDIVAGTAKSYRLREGLKRYWQTDIWGEFFGLMLNPGKHVDVEEGQRLPCTRGVKAVREKMETWLEGNSERGVGLRSMIRRAEGLVAPKRKT